MAAHNGYGLRAPEPVIVSDAGTKREQCAQLKRALSVHSERLRAAQDAMATRTDVPIVERGAPLRTFYGAIAALPLSDPTLVSLRARVLEELLHRGRIVFPASGSEDSGSSITFGDEMSSYCREAQ